ncbi:peptidase domain-containing protein (plasmid) [Leptolyngbya boryana NIES-2135]|jgi:uncharacterized protein (DUF305 family)|uniref:Peptidase domain-containing protein n=1 Tax=Leptolyngbya boryana NIES-2135 TaxID=1973484 RepID=A0A1Z4JRX3_LEPBY|nr:MULTISPECIES: DUF305 domain-containing protein [Leptolyngbya]BAY59454.1 peptidase domain-containing protein [Leptolyngbya boryana NIES-2135]MBD2373037.1 DUF305 domain-containing protein [Leptolyngbya sp. FACHB-238]MBD2397208.1 DUF305 domain-containing protein [Leptolyngbya sp. FACHB-239]MBD2403986.1 DUF305 domain-containing protein [Leptolyngbya sp. FACHB-402]ULP33282.1 DUF305 domain-containing protein [Leptolyngbya boryana IU 594]
MFQSRSPLTTDLVSTSSSIVSPLTTDSLTTVDSGLRLPSLASSDVRAASTVAPNDSAARFDVRYLQETIDHHTMAIEMAELAVDKAVNDDLRSLAQGIVDTQTEERSQMQTWLRDWYGFNYSPDLNFGEERMIREMSRMEGAEFEIDFMRQMTMHHEAGISDAVPCTERAGHAELKDLCSNIASTQQSESDQMRQWLRDRYQTSVDMMMPAMGGLENYNDSSIPNGSFENGDFTGWSTVGKAEIQPLDYGVFPTDGIFQALLTTERETASPSELASFLGVDSNVLNNLGDGNIDQGSAIKLTFDAKAGDTVSFDWNFLTNELDSTLVDPSKDFLFVTLEPLALTAADPNSASNSSRTMFSNETGYETFSAGITQSGTYTLGIGVANVGDPLFDSAVLLDNFKLVSA